MKLVYEEQKNIFFKLKQKIYNYYVTFDFFMIYWSSNTDFDSMYNNVLKDVVTCIDEIRKQQAKIYFLFISEMLVNNVVLF